MKGPTLSQKSVHTTQYFTSLTTSKFFKKEEEDFSYALDNKYSDFQQKISSDGSCEISQTFGITFKKYPKFEAFHSFLQRDFLSENWHN